MASEDAFPVPICDAHMHYWDTVDRPNPNLGDAAENRVPKYFPADYAEDTKGLPVKSVVHVETTVGQEPGGFKLDPLDESKWAASLGTPVPFVLVAYAHLAREDAADALAAQAALGYVVGIRQILNHHETDMESNWPQVEDLDWFNLEAFRTGYAMLKTHNFSFDFQANPHQLAAGANFFKDFPETPVIVNHMGCVTLEEKEIHDDWVVGMKALAELPHTYLKLSFGARATPDWPVLPDSEEKLRLATLEAIEIFGAKRCMFASNFPVDKVMGVPTATMLYQRYYKWVKDAGYSDEDINAMFHDTAARVYRVYKTHEEASAAAPAAAAPAPTAAAAAAP